MDSKVFFLEKVFEMLSLGGAVRVLDVGSGESKNFLPLLKKFPNCTYVGVEPSKSAADSARELLKQFPNARVYNQLAYEPLTDEEPFDLTISLSVLEHVKQLDVFLKNSVAMTKQGGHIIHRYDLGHALSPSSLKERLQVFLGNHIPSILPEHKFVQYLSPDAVAKMLSDAGAVIERITYHQMPSHKSFLKAFVPETDDDVRRAQELSQWEFDISPRLQTLPTSMRERLFPTIAVWAKKG